MCVRACERAYVCFHLVIQLPETANGRWRSRWLGRAPRTSVSMMSLGLLCRWTCQCGTPPAGVSGGLDGCMMGSIEDYRVDV